MVDQKKKSKLAKRFEEYRKKREKTLGRKGGAKEKPAEGAASRPSQEEKDKPGSLKREKRQKLTLAGLRKSIRGEGKEGPEKKKGLALFSRLKKEKAEEKEAGPEEKSPAQEKPPYISEKEARPQEAAEKKEPAERDKTALPKKKEEKKAQPEELDIRKLFKKEHEKKKKHLSAAQRRRRLEVFLEKSGLEIGPLEVKRRIFWISLVLVTITTIIFVSSSIGSSQRILGLIIQILIIWTMGFILCFSSIWLVFTIVLDLMMMRRKLQIEDVLPDFLQLTSANIRAGMPIDKALWFAVRPRFGILAREIEDVAKRTLSGDELSKALIEFGRKYDSTVLIRSINLLIEGMEAGGDVGDLLNKISLNIQDLRSTKREMSANVTTYVIFITFASIVAAPILFGLSHELLNVVQSIAGEVASGTETKGVSMGLTISMDTENIKIGDYRIFAYVSLLATSLFSAMIVATIRKGSIKEDFELIPIFMATSLSIFFIATKLMAWMFSGFH